jgi:methylase of polypeptide subunit release factors
MIIMPKKSTLKQVRKKFEARMSRIKREYENKISKLEERIGKNKTERDARLARSERRFRKEFCLILKEIIGREDYEWLIQWLVKSKETETEEAEKRLEKALTNELKEMSPEDYLFRYLSDPEIEKRLNESREASKPEDIMRLTSIVTKLKLEKAWVDRTLI